MMKKEFQKMRLCKFFLFATIFLFLSGCSVFGSVDYNKIETFDVVLRDVNNQVVSCHFQRGYNVKCVKGDKNETL